MKKILQFVPVQLTLFLVIGILVGYYFEFNKRFLPSILIGLLFVLGAFYVLANKSFHPKLHFNFVGYILLFFIGVSSMTIKNELNDQQHYSHFISEENDIVLIIERTLKSSSYYDKYEASVAEINTKITIGKILLNVEKDSLNLLKVDDKIYLNSDFRTLIPPMNPYYFDYKEYLKKKNIYHQLFTSNEQFFQLPKRGFSFKGLAAQLRLKINKALIKNNFEGDELGVINALLLGQRQDISPQLIQSYTGAGAIHILAVSGLHIGIILLILNFLFQPLEQLKNGKFIKMVVVVFLLWVFAFIAGMSASVVRAVTMFTAVAIGILVNKSTNVYNTLVISMFFLLLFNPYFLFDVGFQLSYLAVFSIVWIQPILYGLWQPKWKLFDFFWKLLSVSFAAQIGIIPISFYYFHQFPSLFFISNLAIIPVLGGILIGGIVVIVLALFDVLPSFLATLYNWVIRLMNVIVEWVAQQESFLIQNISFSILMVLLFYGIIIFGIRFFTDKKVVKLALFLIAVLALQFGCMYEKNKRLNTDAFIVFHKSRYSLVAKRIGNEMAVFHSLDSLTFSKDKVLNQYKVGVGQLTVSLMDSIPNIHQFKNKTILVVDSLGVYQINGFRPEIVILQYSPKINMDRLIDSLNPKIIIADGSNYKSYITRWELTCEQKNTPFHYTGRKGAFIIKD